MLKALKFVQGSVGKLGDENALEHFQIRAGRVTGHNGVLAISVPIALDMECQPNAKQLIQAIVKCEDAASLTLMSSGKLKVASGKFKAMVACHPEDLPIPVPEGLRVQINGDSLVKAFKTLVKFVGNDSSRPWSNGILLKQQSAYATNNGAAVEYWLGQPMPFTVNVPLAAVKEIIRVGTPPVFAMATPKAISFHYEDESWIRTATLSSEWPDMAMVLGRQANAIPFQEGFFEALDAVKPFVDALQRVHLLAGALGTTADGDATGAVYSVEGQEPGGVFQWAILDMLRGVADKIDFSTYPKPCLFYGDQLRGAIMGMRG
jgi:hypothetical protein